MMTPKTPPEYLGKAGRRVWRAVTGKYDLERHEGEVLRQIATTADTIAKLEAVVERDGVLAETSQGTRAHPAVVEARQQRLAMARLLASLQLPIDVGDGDTGDTGDGEDRPQRRSGVRGVYSIAGGA